MSVEDWVRALPSDQRFEISMNDAYKTCVATGAIVLAAAAAFTGHVVGPAIVAVLGAGLACAIVWLVERRTLSGAGRTDRTRV